MLHEEKIQRTFQGPLSVVVHNLVVSLLEQLDCGEALHLHLKENGKLIGRKILVMELKYPTGVSDSRIAAW